MSTFTSPELVIYWAWDGFISINVSLSSSAAFPIAIAHEAAVLSAFKMTAIVACFVAAVVGFCQVNSSIIYVYLSLCPPACLPASLSGTVTCVTGLSVRPGQAGRQAECREPGPGKASQLFTESPHMICMRWQL